MTDTQVTLFDGEQLITAHRRRHGRRGQYSTDPDHVPAQHQDVAGLWSAAWFTRRAAGIGPATTEIIGQVLGRYEVEAQGYLECQNILESLGKRNKQRLEAACAHLIHLGGYASYTGIKRLMAAIDTDQKKPGPKRAAATTARPPQSVPEDSSQVYVRGAGYYQDQGR